MIKNKLSCPIFSTSGLLFMIVLTLARGSSTSLDLRGELLTTGVFDTDFRAVLPGVLGAVVSDILLLISENQIYNNVLYKLCFCKMFLSI